MKIVTLIDKVFDYMAWLFLTKKCYYCDTVIEKDELLCEECREHLPIISGEKCEYCGAGKDRCGCKKHRMKYDGISSPFYYEDGIQKGLKLLKFSAKDYMARRFADAMADSIREDFAEVKFDFVCYVPFSPIQKIRRRYNQSELLARYLSDDLGIPLKPVLVKVFDNKTQHEMTNYYRAGNVFGIYDVKDYYDIKGKTVLLVDDIKTTGETLNTCAVILKIRGAERVYCTAAALTAKKKKEDK